MMCDRCIYKRICKYVAMEVMKTATDTSCQRFEKIPSHPATQSDEQYLV